AVMAPPRLSKRFPSIRKPNRPKWSRTASRLQEAKKDPKQAGHFSAHRTPPASAPIFTVRMRESQTGHKYWDSFSSPGLRRKRERSISLEEPQYPQRPDNPARGAEQL